MFTDVYIFCKPTYNFDYYSLYNNTSMPVNSFPELEGFHSVQKKIWNSKVNTKENCKYVVIYKRKSQTSGKIRNKICL